MPEETQTLEDHFELFCFGFFLIKEEEHHYRKIVFLFNVEIFFLFFDLNFVDVDLSNANENRNVIVTVFANLFFDDDDHENVNDVFDRVMNANDFVFSNVNDVSVIELISTIFFEISNEILIDVLNR